MSRHGLEDFLYAFDKSPERQAALKEGSSEAFSGFNLDDEECSILFAGDVATLFRWGIHPLLIRNFAGTIGIKYVAEYKKHGLAP
jgi:hypothetical protein